MTTASTSRTVTTDARTPAIDTAPPNHANKLKSMALPQGPLRLIGSLR